MGRVINARARTIHVNYFLWTKYKVMAKLHILGRMLCSKGGYCPLRFLNIINN